MTTLQAIEGVRMLLDESGVEYYKPYEILLALEQAQQYVARSAWAKGKKEVTRPLLIAHVPISGDGQAGFDLTAFLNGERIMYFEALLVKMNDIEATPIHSARYIQPDKFTWHRFPNPGSGSRSGRLEYSFIGNLLYHNGAGLDADLSYTKLPRIQSQTDPLSLPTFAHQAVVDRAAYLLYRKEVGLADHEAAGSNAELQLMDQSQRERAQATAARQVMRQRFKKEFEQEPESELP